MLTLFSLILYSHVVMGGTSARAPMGVPRAQAALSALASPETTLVLPAGSTIVTETGSRVHLRTMAPGDTLYFRVDADLLADGHVVIPAGTFIEGTLRNEVAPRAGDRAVAFRLRARRLIGANGSIGELFGTGARTGALTGAPNDSAYRRGVPVEARATLSSAADVIPAGSRVRLVAASPFTVETLRSFGGPPFVGDVRFSASPPRRECYVAGAAGTPDIVIPGTPATPAIGDQPATPGTPDTRIPGMPAQAGHWQRC